MPCIIQPICPNCPPPRRSQPRSLQWPSTRGLLDWTNIQVQRLVACAASEDLQHTVAMHPGGIERLMQPIDRVDGDSVEADNDIALVHAGLIDRTARLH